MKAIKNYKNPRAILSGAREPGNKNKNRIVRNLNIRR